MRDVAAMVLLLTLSIVVSAQTRSPPARNGVITGQVVDATTGTPVSAAIVSISGSAIPVRAGSSPPSAPPRILTGADGRFVFRDLPSGSVGIQAAKNGYSDGAYGRRRPGGTTQQLALIDSQPRMDITLRMWKYGAIAGTVVDEAGEPVVGVRLRALYRSLSTGRPRFVTTASTGAITDDRGMFRITVPLPGEYLVAVTTQQVTAPSEMPRQLVASGVLVGAPGSPGAIEVGGSSYTISRGAVPPPPTGGRLFIYPTTFYPSALRPVQASTITVAAGEERSAIDLQLQPVPTTRVSGSVVGPADAMSRLTLRLQPADSDEIALEQDAPTAITAPSGAFTFLGVTPGQYTLRASARPIPMGVAGRSDPGLWADVPLTIGGDDTDGVTAVLQPGLRVSGRFEFEGSAERPDGARLAQVQVVIETLDGSSALSGPGAMVNHDNRSTGTFTTPGYPAGTYFLRVGGSPTGWMFKSAMFEGRDLSESPFDLMKDMTGVVVTFTDRWSGIGGVVRSAQGSGDDSATVLVFPTDAQGWTSTGLNPRRLRSTRTNAKGDFGLSSLPAGDYYVVAVPEEQAADWRDPKFLEAAARAATQVTILEGEQKKLDLWTREARQ